MPGLTAKNFLDDLIQQRLLSWRLTMTRKKLLLAESVPVMFDASLLHEIAKFKVSAKAHLNLYSLFRKWRASPQDLTCCSPHVVWRERRWRRQRPCATGRPPGCKGTPRCDPAALWCDNEDAPHSAAHCSRAPGTCNIKVTSNRVFFTRIDTPWLSSVFKAHCSNKILMCSSKKCKNVWTRGSS